MSIVRANADPATTSSVRFTVTFSEVVTGVDITDFTPDFTGIADATVSSVTGSGTTYTVTVLLGSGTGTLSVDLNDNDSIRNSVLAQLGGFGAGNGDFTTGETYTVNKLPPSVVSITRFSAENTSAASVYYVVTFSEAVTGVNVSDFELVSTGTLSGSTITSVAGTGATRTVLVGVGSGSGALRLDLIDDDSIKDAGLTPLGGEGLGNGDFTAGASYSVDRTPPSVVSIVRESGETTTATSVNFIVTYFIVTFSEPVRGVDRTDFAPFITGTMSGATIMSVVGSGTTWTVTVGTGTGSGTLRLDVIDNDSIKDLLNNLLGGPGVGTGSYTTGETYNVR
ncbi:MAG: hypothetical protein HZB50_05455 [Chloroflexi bacterium]|nr:hypothetical protein [Chloroflexota bacterium]